MMSQVFSDRKKFIPPIKPPCFCLFKKAYFNGTIKLNLISAATLIWIYFKIMSTEFFQNCIKVEGTCEKENHFSIWIVLLFMDMTSV